AERNISVLAYYVLHNEAACTFVVTGITAVCITLSTIILALLTFRALRKHRKQRVANNIAIWHRAESQATSLRPEK
ncbi:hypothetical protein PMAYCL1PPCAC_16240, partial [Pristionchus mayeri]